MKKLAYFKIEDNMTPRDASDILALAKKEGYDDVIVYHHENAEITNARYKEKLLSVFRAAYRHKVGLYIADDRYGFSGTGFAQLSSVKDLWQKVMVVKDRENLPEDAQIICEKEGKCLVVDYPEEVEGVPYGHTPEFTNPESAYLLIESVYKPLVNEYKKFVGYEFKGFLSSLPSCDTDKNKYVPFCDGVVEFAKEKNIDLFADIKNNEKYFAFLDKKREEVYASQIKRYCEEKQMLLLWDNAGEIVLEGAEYMAGVDDFPSLISAYEKNVEPVIKVGSDMGKKKNLSGLLTRYPGFKREEISEFTLNSDCIILFNSKDEKTSLGLLLGDDWCIYDWEKDEYYDFEKRATYTFFPKSFLCLVKRKDIMYTDKLPVRVGSVVTWDYEEKEQIEFEKRDNKYAFYLPDDSLSDKAVMIKGSCSSIKAKLGAMEYYLTEKPYILPLFDFQREAGCLIEAESVEKISIITKKPME